MSVEGETIHLKVVIKLLSGKYIYIHIYVDLKTPHDHCLRPKGFKAYRFGRAHMFNSPP